MRGAIPNFQVTYSFLREASTVDNRLGVSRHRAEPWGYCRDSWLLVVGEHAISFRNVVTIKGDRNIVPIITIDTFEGRRVTYESIRVQDSSIHPVS